MLLVEILENKEKQRKKLFKNNLYFVAFQVEILYHFEVYSSYVYTNIHNFLMNFL